MGYTSTMLSRKALIAERTAGFTRDFETGDRFERVCLKSCWKGNVTHQGRLWCLWEDRHYNGVNPSVPENVVRWIGLDLCSRRNDGWEWGYKDLDETMGPYEFDCPVSYVHAATATDSKHASEWRARVLEHAATLAKGREAYNTLKPGDVVILRAGLTVRVLTVEYATGKTLANGRNKNRSVSGFDTHGVSYRIAPSYVRANVGPVSMASDEVAEAIARIDGRQLATA